MCGIVGIVSRKPVVERLLDALKRLEYRGYDSSGIATIHNKKINRCRAEGKLSNLEQLLKVTPLEGSTGIAHTRWATHGLANEINAHPHWVDGVAVIHNGIIENFSEIKDKLLLSGITFSSQTDTEVIVQLLAKFKRDGMNSRDSMTTMLKHITGAYTIAAIFEDDPYTILSVRNGPPLIIGHGEQEMFLASDAVALAPFTNKMTYIEDGDLVILKPSSFCILDFNGTKIERPSKILQPSNFFVEKGLHRHFMEKEIYEQPEAISRTLSHYVNFTEKTIIPDIFQFDFAKLSGLAISACGTAYLSGLVSKYWFNRFAKLPVEIDVASEFRYRDLSFPSSWAALFISQSGETADTLAALRCIRAQKLNIGSIVNIIESTIARESNFSFPILAGPEIGVASTKAFTCQLLVLAMMAIYAGKMRGVITETEEKEFVSHLIEIPRIMSHIINNIHLKIEELCREISKCLNVLYIGRGTNFPLALEGALKLKEVSYIHAEGYAAGELKHGPIALIDETIPIIVIAPYDKCFEKTVSNMEEAAARRGRIIMITDQKGASSTNLQTLAKIVLPNVHELIAPIVFSLPIQMIAYHTAVFIGTDVDQPRNLAKSVTVE
ncbi:Glucosamine--fructose-6-phosphate aminotransferase (isomerizing) [Liberibacter crescens BT-1]|uniref:Glutamine--fructose-6-phosphate aminotransferase [isomerizing] n=1 Tax=Liberibacter crescens (strain BT-1) TaxID=1215343 RepID=L0ET21_LIBCB|nr:glutamine--fructose-6-phosphate transaminase (isomerizing) [Liberibacter crescens]AGA64679.1 Glucosamine--fructose-6-phosphate aminotransferase (isomerizing) [Liberibacter crescens BT-1]AMC12779.1 glucosamine--fructose-6-phosphate aminotransferase [Liberibacter crescens]